jgi:7,8-dihydropterin-6-yl-methyl-4-(beta-D-ribofuranosyl)aminobenzene 5'-phosphate synthase
MRKLTGLLVSVTLISGCAAGVPATPLPIATASRLQPTMAPPQSQTMAAATPTMAAATPTEAPSPTRNRITVIYDNVPYDKRLKTDWGFAALVEYRGQSVLFDTGANGEILLANMRTLGIDPAAVSQVFLSHVHSDHTGGLLTFLAVSSKPPVYLLTAFGPAFLGRVLARTKATETSPGMEIAPGMFTTGKVAGGVPEQALVIRTQQGLVVITGCAHPGVVRMLQAAISLSGEPVYMVIGGFHLYDSSSTEISAVLTGLRHQGVRKVAPSHCTGDAAISMFAHEYGEDFIPSGAGIVIPLGT